MRLKLEDECCFINGGSWTANEYAKRGYAVLKVSNFDKDSISYKELSFLQEESYPKYKRNELHIHDIVIATVGSHPSLVNSAAGRVITIPKQAEGLLLNQNAVCLRVKDQNKINQRYLGYLCKSQLFQNFIQQRGKGAANQMRIPISGIKSYTYDFPRIETQRKIAAILSAYDDLIENNLKRIQLLEEKAQLTYEEWFVRMKFPGHEATPINEETGLPEGWEKVKIEDVIEVGRGSSPRPISDQKYFEDGDIPWLKIADATASNIFIYKTKQKVNEYGASFSRKLPIGSIVVAASGTLGFPMILGVEACIHDGWLYFKGIEEKLKEYFYFSFIGLRKYFEAISYGAAIQNINTGIVQQSPFIIPDEKTSIEFKKTASSIFESINGIQKQNQLLKEARDILLPRLMSGVINVQELDLSAFELGDQEEMLMAAEPKANYKK